ncbi:MAG: serine/threonine protein kinase [Deltaproteobacteria bacterium]|nr:serine/threonine protein kinase [Deltaproteobacteria bacterium]
MGKNIKDIGKYHVLKPIGKGGMAEVFAVEKTGPGGFEKQLCLKRIRRDLARDPEFIQSFESEARLVAKLEHPNIVQVFDFFREDKDLCMVMELVDGMDLNGILRHMANTSSQIPVTIAVYIMESLLRALHYAHHLDIKGQEVCVIHRDISPQNLLLSKTGVVKLADFGIAKAKGLSPDTTQGCLKGKLSYLAPERLKLGKVPVGAQSDLFSAGIVFWEMLATRKLFKATMEHRVLSKVMHFEKAPIDYLRPEMNQFLERILAPNPVDRFGSAYEALFALKQVGVDAAAQEEVARLVREVKRIRTLTENHMAEQQKKTDADENDRTIPVDSLDIHLDAADAQGASPASGSSRKSTPRLGYAIGMGILLLLIVTGVWAAFKLFRDNSPDVQTVKEAIQTEIQSQTPLSPAQEDVIVDNTKHGDNTDSATGTDNETAIKSPEKQQHLRPSKKRSKKKHDDSMESPSSRGKNFVPFVSD